MNMDLLIVPKNYFILNDQEFFRKGGTAIISLKNRTEEIKNLKSGLNFSLDKTS